MTLPNIISLGRLLIALVSFYLMFQSQWLWAAVLILISVVLDIADGRIARRYNKVTTGGIYLDVMADKIVIISTFLIIGYLVNFSFFILGILMLIREYSIDTIRTIAANKQKVLSADKFSKIKGILFMVAMVGMIFNQALVQSELWTLIFVLLASIGMIFAYLTLIRFFVKQKKIILE